MSNSFIVTGASAVGKTTLIEYAKTKGYNYLLGHTTRKLRENETNGIDIVSISENEFIDNFNNNVYFEPTLDSALHKGISIYYGTPREWLEKLQYDNYCGAPSSPITARIIVKECKTIWVHLFCDKEIRYKRLKERGLSESEILGRLNSGDSINNPEDATILIDTGKLTPSDILNIIQDYNM